MHVQVLIATPQAGREMSGQEGYTRAFPCYSEGYPKKRIVIIEWEIYTIFNYIFTTTTATKDDYQNSIMNS